MFKIILIPTDGSPLSETAIQKGVQLAKITHARVIGLHVTPQYHLLTYRTDMLENTKEEFAADSRLQAMKYLDMVKKIANEMNVTCDNHQVVSDHPYEAIIQTAKEKGCDAIVMASHGRNGAAGVILGSQTQKVLTHCQIPVLVIR